VKRTYPVEVLWCGNPSRNSRVARGAGQRTGWIFPPAVERQLKRDTQGQSVLHLFGGQSRFGTRLDIDPALSPDVVGDAWLPPFGRDTFDVVILDPPYFRINAQEKTALFRAAAWIARSRVIWFSTTWVSASGGLATEAGYLVRVGDSCLCRCLQYFRVVRKIGPVKHFTRGPMMKYNRWLHQPEMLPGFVWDKEEPRAAGQLSQGARAV